MQRGMLKEAISDTISRFKRIIDKEIQGELLWKQISKPVLFTFDFFRNVIKIYIQQAERFESEINSLPSQIEENSYIFYHKRISQLNSDCVEDFRSQLFVFYQQNFDEQLSSYLFLEELISVFPASMNYLKENLYFFFVPLGNIMVYTLHKDLTEERIPWLDDDLKIELIDLQRDDIRVLGAVPEESIVSQIILAHEIFHVIVDKNNSIRDKLNEMASDSDIMSLLNQTDVHILKYWIEEFFCDCGASFLFGPVFGKEFVKELVYTKAHATPTHPPRKWRIQFILELFKNMKHPFIPIIRNYLKSITYEQANLDINKITRIINQFQLLLIQCGLGKYKYSNKRKEIYTLYFKNKLPYEYKKDIRHFLNNLPKDKNLSNQEKEEFDLMITESVRKNVLKRDFEETMEKLAQERGLAKKG